MKKILVDFDEVIARTTVEWIKFLEKNYSIKVNINDLTDYHDMAGGFNLELQFVLDVWDDFYKQNITLESTIEDGCVKILSWLKKKGFEIEILTSRANRVADQVSEYLKKHGLDFITRINCCNTFEKSGSVSKGEIFVERRGNFFVEDTFSNAVSVAEAAPSAKVFLLDRPWNQNPITHSNIIRVHDWYDIGYYMELE